MKLTHEQQEIIELEAAHCVITAVAGSGKTTTLAHRICRLIDKGQNPRHLLILMYNKKAREDFALKLQHTLAHHGERYPKACQRPLPEIRTYHAMGYRLYTTLVEKGYLPPFDKRVLTDQEIHFQLWQILQKITPQNERHALKQDKKAHIETAARFIELVKSSLLSPETLYRENRDKFGDERIIDVFHQFEHWRTHHRRISFADMLWEPVRLMDQQAEVHDLVTNHMDVILVDEYQDTNEVQHQLLSHIAGTRAKVTVVGDPDQTIYEFRGARPEFILQRFGQEYPDHRALTLSCSFRYGHRIALAANHVIHHNQGRTDILSVAHPSASHTELSVHPRDDGKKVVELIRKAHEEGLASSQIAILFRLWSQSVETELALLAAGIHYSTGENRGALACNELDGLLLVLQFALHMDDQWDPGQRRHALKRLLKFPHCGLKEPQLEQLVQWLCGDRQHWLAFDRWPGYKTLSAYQKRKIRRLAEVLTTLRATSSHTRAADLLERYVLATDLTDQTASLSFTREQAEEKQQRLEGFLRYIEAQGLPPAETLNHFAHLREQARIQKETAHTITITTIHRAKGLEWDVVMLPGLADAQFPYLRKDESATPDLLEQERRLFYVAMTRAKRHLHLLLPSAAKRVLPSRFIEEACLPLAKWLADRIHDKECADRTEAPLPLTVPEPLGQPTAVTIRYAAQHRVELKTTPPKTTPSPDEGTPAIWQHDRVRHTSFGVGQVVQEQENAFSVRFRNGRQKTFKKASAHLFFRPM